MIKVGIIGATGYAGGELVRLLIGHKDVEIKWYGSRSHMDKKYSDVFQNMFKIVEARCLNDNIEKLAEEVDVIFTATPQGYLSGILTEKILDKVKLVDLSADYRIKDVKIYEEWYQIEHKTPQFIHEAVYGLCEINREKIQKARLVANPGCYTTCSILSIYPIVKAGLIENHSIIIDAKSGASGAGRGMVIDHLYCEVNENIKAYGVASHRHTPEIEEQLGYAANEKIVLNFTPHLVPMNRGILTTAYANLKEQVSYADIIETYNQCYNNETFIRILEKDICPQTKWVQASNYVDIGFKIDPRTKRLIMMGALDNIVKGAAGQAIQNMNIMFGIDEKTGLIQAPTYI